MDVSQPGAELVAAFNRWAAGERVAAAARNRVRERSLRDQATASATWAGALVDLAEERSELVIVVGGERRPGRIIGVGRDFCVLDQPSGKPALVAFDAISAVWPAPGSAPLPAGSRQPTVDLSFVVALAALAEERPAVAATLAGGTSIEGEMVAVGEDLVSIRTNSPDRRSVYARAAAIALCEIR